VSSAKQQQHNNPSNHREVTAHYPTQPSPPYRQYHLKLSSIPSKAQPSTRLHTWRGNHFHLGTRDRPTLAKPDAV